MNGGTGEYPCINLSDTRAKNSAEIFSMRQARLYEKFSCLLADLNAYVAERMNVLIFTTIK